MAAPQLAMAFALFGGTAYRYFVEDREKRKVKGLFGRYVSRDVYAQLLENPGLAQLGGRRRDDDGSVLRHPRLHRRSPKRATPEELVAQLNEYFTRMVDIVFRQHGTVDKFVGDMVMALFGAPVDDVDHAEHAVAAAVEMVRELGVLNQQWAAEGRARLDIGIGVNTGDMIAGNIGSSSIMSYTVIGDNVNLGVAARVAEQGLPDPHYHQRRDPHAAQGRLRASARSATSSSRARRVPVAIFEVVVPSPIPAVHEDVQT